MSVPLFSPRGTLAPLPRQKLAKVVGPQATRYARGREIAALALWVGSAFLLLALLSFEVAPQATDPQAPAADPLGIGSNWMGPFGAFCARNLVHFVGVVAWLVPLEFVLLGIPFVRNRKSEFTPLRMGSGLLIAFLAAALVQVGWARAVAFGNAPAAGLAGELFGELLRSLFSTAGSFLIGSALLALILIGRATFSFIALLQNVHSALERFARWAMRVAHKVLAAWQVARKQREAEVAELREQARPIIAETKKDRSVLVANPPEEEDGADVPAALFSGPDSDSAPLVAIRDGAVPDSSPTDDKLDATRAKCIEPIAGGPAITVSQELGLNVDVLDKTDVSSAPVFLEAKGADAVVSLVPPNTQQDEAKNAASQKDKGKEAAGPKEPTIVDTSAALKKEITAKKKKEAAAALASFRLPSIDLLVAAKAEPQLSVDREILFKNSDLLVKTLADYGVSGKVEEILPGPTVTTYEVSPAAGTKVSKVASLADDLALALARKVRIVAPIPGKNRIGFELPNERRAPVGLRDLVEDERFKNLDVPLPVVMGRDIVGNPVYADLASMPHVIVAGATGAGKSVGLNVMLTSLLYRRAPEDLRMLMIDPKVVELAPFDRIPHMLLPVVTDMKQASNALKWAVDEMERRYQLFADAGTKNITTYNQWVQRVARGEAKNPLPKTIQAKDKNGFVDEIPAGEGEEGTQQLPEKMPFIVIVVDEFADLMMQQGKEVEAAIARLAQKARAAGMHVILATQRPSVDVITGMIKANFPTRIAFRVAQKVDSRTILDEQGAEHLLGRGDMLIRLNGTNETRRVQCPWVSEEEVQAITDHLRAQGEPVYDENILKPRDEEGNADDDEEESQDSMYDEAVRIVADTRRCSTSWLQRKLGLGYNRAARIVEMMEKRGLVGPANGSKDREVLISSI
jgi:DNA segregation ATPase FtsK/SpoIIIE, S-DNA-T family